MRIEHLIWLTVILFAIFCAVSLFHAYSFTHPVLENAKTFVPKRGMDLSFMDKIKALFLGIRPIKKTVSEFPTDYGMDYEAVSFKSRDQIKLQGWYIEDKNSSATVLLAHGYFGNKAGMLKYAKFLHQRGYTIFMFDFRASGESEGDTVSMGYYERLDVLGAVDYLRSIHAKEPFFGLGISMGAAALTFAEKEEPVFNVLALDSMYTTIHKNTARRFKEVYNFPSFPFATTLTFFGGILIHANGFKVSPLESLQHIHVPVLIIQGNADTSVFIEDALALYNNANEPKLLWIVDGAQHSGAYDANPQDYANVIDDFFDIMGIRRRYILRNSGGNYMVGESIYAPKSLTASSPYPFPFWYDPYLRLWL